MATRYPLVLDTADNNKIKELPNGDNLNLSGNNIVNAVNITASGVISASSLSLDSSSFTIGGQTLATVATTGQYNDLSGRPTLFSGSYNDLTDKPILKDTIESLDNVDTGTPNDNDVLQYNATLGRYVPGSIGSVSLGSSNIQDLGNVQVTSVATNQVLKWNGALFANANIAFSEITSKPTTLAGYGIIDAQESLVSGTNIKTVNGGSLLGSGDLTVATSFASLTGKPTTLAGYGITDAQATLVSATNIKTINGATLLGSGDLTVSGSGGDVVDDTTPQLGGNLDVNGNKITSTSGGDIDIEPDGTGDVLLGNFKFDVDQTVGAGQDNYVMTYDNSTGKISLEAASGGAGGILNTAGNTGTGSVTLASETLQVLGTTGEINVEAAAFALSLSLADNISGILTLTATTSVTGGAVILSGSNIDTTDSSAITVTPAVTMSSDLTVENDLTVGNNIIADSFQSVGAGTPTLTSDSSIILSAVDRVNVTVGPLNQASYTTTLRDGLSSVNGDMIYNTSTNVFQGYANGSWVNLSGSAGIANVVEDLSPQLGADLDGNGFNINLGDDKKVNFGASTDLQIYHDSTFNNSVINNVTGHLVIRNDPSNTTKDVFIQSDNDVLITSIAAGETFAKFSDDAGVELYYDDVKKFNTTTDGIEVTGDVFVNGGSIKYQFNITNDNTDHYVFTDPGSIWFPTSENDPTLYLRRGEQYLFNNTSGGHPFRIQSTTGTSRTPYNTGVANNGGTGQVIFKVPMSAPATLYYQCTSHTNMNGTINIV